MRIRSGTIADVPAIARVYVDAWKTTYQGLVPELFLKGMTFDFALKIFMESFEDKVHSYQVLVAETSEGKMVGYADFGRERSHPESGEGELYGIYLLKEFQKQGIGGELFERARQKTAEAGLKPLVVWVLDQSPYRKFYEKTGGKLRPGVKTLGPTGSQVQLVCYAWENQI